MSRRVAMARPLGFRHACSGAAACFAAGCPVSGICRCGHVLTHSGDALCRHCARRQREADAEQVRVLEAHDDGCSCPECEPWADSEHSECAVRPRFFFDVTGEACP